MSFISVFVTMISNIALHPEGAAVFERVSVISG
jgi:hypothetical protein